MRHLTDSGGPIIKDDYVRLEQRIDWLKSGSVLAVAGLKGSMRRIVSNIEVLEEGPDGGLKIGSNFIPGIARKTVFLINSSREIPLLQFLI